MAIEEKRTVKNYLINRPLQVRMGYYFASISLALVGAGVVYLNYNVSFVRGQFARIEGLPYSFQMALESRMSHMLYFSAAFLLIAVIFNLLYGIYISHRIAGPMYAILKYIQSLREKNYSDTRNLRPNDELRPIMDALHELAHDLQHSQNSSAKK